MSTPLQHNPASVLPFGPEHLQPVVAVQWHMTFTDGTSCCSTTTSWSEESAPYQLGGFTVYLTRKPVAALQLIPLVAVSDRQDGQQQTVASSDSLIPLCSPLTLLPLRPCPFFAMQRWRSQLLALCGGGGQQEWLYSVFGYLLPAEPYRCQWLISPFMSMVQCLPADAPFPSSLPFFLSQPSVVIQ